MSDEKATRERHPLNAEGDFYVENDICLCCDAPIGETPELMECDQDTHCYFKRQPETREEVEHAINAVLVSCVEALRYAGNDPYILERLEKQRQSCDSIEKKCSRKNRWWNIF
jgi:hypothetical protein